MFTKDPGTCAHENLGLCDDCGMPMCKDCGASCNCDHSAEQVKPKK